MLHWLLQTVLWPDLKNKGLEPSTEVCFEVPTVCARSGLKEEWICLFKHCTSTYCFCSIPDIFSTTTLMRTSAPAVHLAATETNIIGCAYVPIKRNINHKFGFCVVIPAYGRRKNKYTLETLRFKSVGNICLYQKASAVRKMNRYRGQVYFLFMHFVDCIWLRNLMIRTEVSLHIQNCDQLCSSHRQMVRVTLLFLAASSVALTSYDSRQSRVTGMMLL